MRSPIAVHGDACPTLSALLRSLVEESRCASILHLACTASTNAVAMAEIHRDEDPSPLPRLIVADTQTGGRGRAGRSWHSDAGTLTISLVYPIAGLRLAEDALPLIALAAGMGVADAIESMLPPIQTHLKWPNDVYAGGGKVAGILVETSSGPPRRVVVGIGVNVATDLNRAAADVLAKARSLDALCGRPLQRYDLLSPIVQQMQQRLDQLAADRPGLLDQYRARCWLTGRSVRIPQGGRLLEGLVLGVQDDGALMLRTSAGVVAIRSGEAVL